MGYTRTVIILVLFLSGLTGLVFLYLCDFFDKDGISPELKRLALEILKICIDDIPAMNQMLTGPGKK